MPGRRGTSPSAPAPPDSGSRRRARWTATTTPYLATLPWGRFLDLLEARIIAADPAAAEARREAAELDRFVVTGQSTEHGLKTLIAKATAGEVIYLVAMVDRLAQILELEGDSQPGRGPPLQGARDPRPPGAGSRPAPQVRDPFGG